MKGKFFKRAAAMVLALAIMSGITPFESVSDINESLLPYQSLGFGR